jgi:hypothetical protein
MENKPSPELSAALSAWWDKRKAAREQYLAIRRSPVPDNEEERTRRARDIDKARMEMEKLNDFPWDIVGLGTRSDMKIALELGYGVKAVSFQRRRRGIPAFNARHGGQP